MVLLENPFGLVEIQMFVRHLLPGQGQQPVDVGARDRGFGALGRHGLHAVQLLEGLLLGLLAHARFDDLLAQPRDLVLLALLAQLLLDHAHLLAQDVVLVLLVHALPRLLVQLLVHGLPGGIEFQEFHDRVQARLDLELVQHALLLAHFGRNETCHGVDGAAQGQLLDLIQGKQAARVGVAHEEGAGGLVEGFQQRRFAGGGGLVQDGDLRLDHVAVVDVALQLDPRDALHAHLVVVLGQGDEGFHQGQRTHGVETLLLGFFLFGIALGEHHEVVAGLDSQLEGSHRGFAPHHKGYAAAGEQNHVADWNRGKGEDLGGTQGAAPWSRE